MSIKKILVAGNLLDRVRGISLKILPIERPQIKRIYSDAVQKIINEALLIEQKQSDLSSKERMKITEKVEDLVKRNVLKFKEGTKELEL